MSGWLWSLTPMYWVTVEPQDGQNWDPAGDDRGRFAHRTVIRGCVTVTICPLHGDLTVYDGLQAYVHLPGHVHAYPSPFIPL
jgi:hypothetical protein